MENRILGMALRNGASITAMMARTLPILAQMIPDQRADAERIRDVISGNRRGRGDSNFGKGRKIIDHVYSGIRKRQRGHYTRKDTDDATLRRHPCYQGLHGVRRRAEALGVDRLDLLLMTKNPKRRDADPLAHLSAMTVTAADIERLQVRR